MRTHISTFIAVLSISLLIVSPRASAVEADEVLLLAEDVGRWITRTTIEHESGNIWPDDALAAENVGYDLASGVSGKVVFFIALYRATGNNDYLNQATQGADFLITVLDDPSQFNGDQRRASLYAGLAGIGVALLHVKKEAPAEKYDTALQLVLELLDVWSISDDDGLHWSDRFNDLIYGDAGTALFLAQLSQIDGYSHALGMARQGARFLLGQSVEENEGRYWLFRRDKEFNLPNFSHGTAGVAYVLATVGVLSEDEDLLRGAKAGFSYVRSIAEESDGQLRLPYGWGSEDWQGLYEFGWAHGLTGSSLMFLRMQELNIEKQHAEELLSLSRKTLVDINLPGLPTEPFAEPSTPLDLRFGRAGVLSLASFWAVEYPNDTKVVALRDALFEHIQATAVRDVDSAHWLVDVPAFMGGGRAAYTGMFHGAAGIGLALLNMHASLVGIPRYADLPDDPL